jgi:uncharacterized protein (UPF0548 family)
VFAFRRPSPAALDAFRAAQAALDFTYTGVGTTAHTPPPGYVVDRTRIPLGEGEVIFSAARAALARWEQFRLGWVEAYPADTPITSGAVVAVVAHVLGTWWVNACRIVYTVDEAGAVCRFGFAYGTLPDHVESGEERFLIEWDRATDAVHYDILAFSRPRHPLPRLGYPLTRHTQRRFARDSAASMCRAVAPVPGAEPGAPG